MTKAAACAAIALSLSLTQRARAAETEGGPRPRLFDHAVETHVKDYKELTLFLLKPESGKMEGVMCVCMLGKGPDEVRAQLLGTSDRRASSSALEFAADRNLAVVAWAARQLWDPSRNWDELQKSERKRISVNFELVSKAWDKGIKFFVNKHGLPESGYLMIGSSAAAQFAQRLALRCPKRFLAVHAHIASSFDIPVKNASSLLWCVTTGENELGYNRSRKFFRAARDMRYPIVYKAYPGLGHAGSDMVSALGFACFDYALKEYAHATRLKDGKRTMPNWAEIFESSAFVADVVHQRVYPKSDEAWVPAEFRMNLPAPLRDMWNVE